MTELLYRCVFTSSMPFPWIVSIPLSSENGSASTGTNMGGKVRLRRRLHKLDLTYFVERFKCTLTGNVLANITYLQCCMHPSKNAQLSLTNLA